MVETKRVFRFLKLSKLVKIILLVPMRSVGSESAYSNVERILDQFRSSLAPETIEGLMISGQV